jgi:stage II sporulation protein D
LAAVRVALVRDADSMEQTMQAVFQSKYEGNVRIIKASNGKFAAINTLGVEDYLKGVIGREMSPGGPIEALKAQAIAARTHAMFSAEDSLGAPYDLVANISQAYQGIDRRTRRVQDAVDATRNEVISYRGTLVPTFFHASCGGHTASIEEVWKQTVQKAASSSAMPPSVYCSACAATAHHQWQADVTHSSFTKKMKSWGAKIGELVRVEVMGRTASGRVSQVRLIGSHGNETISSEKLRSLIGYNVLKSGFFEVEKTSGGILFKGEGWGHGVGLCQFGAQRMAERGATCRQILAHYFPGSKIVSYKPSERFAALQKSKTVAMD